MNICFQGCCFYYYVKVRIAQYFVRNYKFFTSPGQTPFKVKVYRFVIVAVAQEVMFNIAFLYVSSLETRKKSILDRFFCTVFRGEYV